MMALQKTELNLLITELSEYHIRLIGFAKQARRELKNNIARIFEAISFSKQIEALRILNYMGCNGNTNENLDSLIGYRKDFNTNKSSEISYLTEVIERFDEIEEKNRHLYICAKDSAELEKDLNIGNINVCSKCGYVLVGEAPKECTICHSPSGYFRVF